MQKLIHILLNSEETLLMETLENLNVNNLLPIKDALILLWQVHPDETIKDKALEYVITILDEAEKTQIETTFEIFHSILEYFPWMGDYTDLQKNNFARFEQGKAHYESLLVQSSILVEYYLDLGRKLYMMFELINEAQVCFEGIIHYDAQNNEALYALGRLAERNLQMDSALDFYERCVAQNPSHVYGLLQLGILRANEFEDYEGAITCYDKVIEIEPFMAETHVRVAEAHYALKDVKRAKQFIDIALDINEYQEEALNLLGQIQWHHDEDIDAAIETFEKGLDHPVHGDSGLLLSSLGDLHNAHIGDHDKAKMYYEKALKSRTKKPETLRKLIVILENIYQDYGAISLCYETYLLSEKNDPSIYVDYANFLIKYMHDYEFAKVQLTKALAIDSTYEMALKSMRQISQYFNDDFDNDVDDDDDDFDDDDDDDEFIGGGAAGDS